MRITKSKVAPSLKVQAKGRRGAWVRWAMDNRIQSGPIDPLVLRDFHDTACVLISDLTTTLKVRHGGETNRRIDPYPYKLSVKLVRGQPSDGEQWDRLDEFHSLREAIREAKALLAEGKLIGHR